MTLPNPREIGQVSAILALESSEVTTLWSILGILGFDIETLALVWDKPVNQVEGAFHGKRGLSGEELAEICSLIHLRPAAVQKRINFNETKLRVTRHGFKSRPKILDWVGPPELCLDGHTGDGRVFKELYLLPGVSGYVPERSRLERPVLNQIGTGKYGVSLQLLRDVAAAVEQLHPTHPKRKKLTDLLGAFPPGIRTVEDVFDQSSEPTKPTEAAMGREMIEYIDRCRAKKVGPNVWFIVTAFELEGWVAEHFEWDAAKLERLEANEDGVTREALELFVHEMGRKRLTVAARDCFNRLDQFVRGAPERVPKAAPQPTKILGDHGETWFPKKGQVRIGGRTYQVSGTGPKALPPKFFPVLNELRRERGFAEWEPFLEAIGITRSIMASMQNGGWEASREKVNDLLLGVRSATKMPKLTLEQLCGFAEIVYPKRPPKPKPQLLFELGDVKVATSWVLTLRKYRMVHRKFRADYGLTEAAEKEILEAKRSVPVTVHHYLLYLIEQRLSRVSTPKLTLAYKALLKMPESQFDASQFAEPNAIPHKDWLKS